MGPPLAPQQKAQHSSSVTSARGVAFEDIATAIGGASRDESYLLLEEVTKLQLLYASHCAIKELPEMPKLSEIAKNKKPKRATDDKNVRQFPILAVFGNGVPGKQSFGLRGRILALLAISLL
jgi:hypothetical protein